MTKAKFNFHLACVDKHYSIILWENTDPYSPERKSNVRQTSRNFNLPLFAKTNDQAKDEVNQLFPYTNNTIKMMGVSL